LIYSPGVQRFGTGLGAGVGRNSFVGGTTLLGGAGGARVLGTGANVYGTGFGKAAANLRGRTAGTGYLGASVLGGDGGAGTRSRSTSANRLVGGTGYRSAYGTNKVKYV